METKLSSFFLFFTCCFSCFSAANFADGFPEDFSEFKEFEKECPNLWSEMEKSHISEFATNCTFSLKEVAKSRELASHKDICLLVNAMLSVACKSYSKDREYTDSFSAAFKEKHSCPINIHLTDDVKLPMFHKILMLLASQRTCQQICYDLDYFVKQCSALIKVNEFFSTLNIATTEKQSIIGIESKNSNETLKHEKDSQMNSEVSLSKTEEKTKTDHYSVGQMQKVGVNSSVTNRFSGRDENKSDTSQYEANPNEQYLKKNVSMKSTKSNEGLNLEKEIVDEFVKDSESDSPKPLPVSNEDVETNLEMEKTLSEDELLQPKQKEFIEATNQNQVYSGGYFQEDSHFFFYFLMFSSVIILAYFAFHNKNKILAYALEGKSDRRSRRRPNPAKYRKLESNLEEAIVSNVTQPSTSSVVY